MKTTEDRRLDGQLLSIAKNLISLKESMHELGISEFFYRQVKEKFDFSQEFTDELIKNYYETLTISQ